MSHLKQTVLLVLGSGPGIGGATSRLFASKGIRKIALVARNPDQLLLDQKSVQRAAQEANQVAEVKTWAVDISDTVALKHCLSEVTLFGPLEVVFFNAARVIPSKLFEYPVEEMERDFKISGSAVYETAMWAIPHLQKVALEPGINPSFFVTNSLLYLNPMVELFSLSMTKAAQRTLTQMLAQEYGQDEVHIGIISVGGVVSPQAKNLNPANIASKIWDFFSQPKGERKFDLVIMEDD